MEFFLCVVGMVMIVEGLPYFAAPDKMKNMIKMLLELPDNSLRGFGGFIMIIGVLVVYIGKYLA
ncbi:MAG: DUF2065 domain-containing protein [Desulfobacteraceae bacterium]|nr:DUF2065 domain-containing protein [Desulfobacteraceae bacterium]